MKKRFRYFSLMLILFFSSSNLKAQCHFIPSTSASVDTVAYTFSGGIFASYGCAPIDPTFWLSGNGIYALATFVSPESYPSFRVWGMNDDDSAVVEVNGVSYPLDLVSASYALKVVCGISPGPDGVVFANGKVVGANSNGLGNYSYSDVTINATNVLTIKVTGTNGAGWGFAGVSVDCAQLPVAAFSSLPNSICPGTCTNFTNLSLNATSYLWTFAGANPSTSTDADPQSICYNTPGNYDVTLIASNASGSDTLTLNNYIAVYPYPPPQGILQNGDTLFANAGAVSYQWYYGGNIISGATDYFYVVTQNGDYNVVATDANGCEVEAAVFDVIGNDGVGEIIEGNGITIFPNPVTNKLAICCGQFAIKNIFIYDILCKLVIDSSLPTANCQLPTQLDVSSLQQGIYYLEINTGEKIFRTKFIKQ